MWLRFAPGEEKVLRILSGAVHERRVHWVDRRSQECAGLACALCKAGLTPKTTYAIDVDNGGTQAVWEMTAGAHRQFVELLPDAAKRPGKEIRVKRVGIGTDTRYILELVTPSAAQAVKERDGNSMVDYDRIATIIRDIIMSDEFAARLVAIFEEVLGTPFEESKEE
jgi:hypothetical protein